MSSFFVGMRLGCYLLSKKCRNYIITGSRTGIDIKVYNDYLLGSSLKMLGPSLTRNLRNCASLLNRNTGQYNKPSDKKERTTAEKLAKDPVVSIVNANNTETVMHLSEAEKYAKSRNMRLVQLESSRTNKVKYKLEKRAEGFDAMKDKKVKTQGKGVKRVILREEIQLHDIQTKINQMLKFIEKDFEVMCLLENSGKPEKLNNILTVLENSQLNNHFHQKMVLKKGVTVIYKKKITDSNDNNPKEKSQSDDVSVKTEN